MFSNYIKATADASLFNKTKYWLLFIDLNQDVIWVKMSVLLI